MLKKRRHILFGILIGVNLFTFLYIVQTQRQSTRIRDYEQLTLDETLNAVDILSKENSELIRPAEFEQDTPGNDIQNEINFNNKILVMPSEVQETESPISPTYFTLDKQIQLLVSSESNETLEIYQNPEESSEIFSNRKESSLILTTPKEQRDIFHNREDSNSILPNPEESSEIFPNSKNSSSPKREEFSSTTPNVEEPYAIFPNPEEVYIHNDYWQIYRNKNISFQLYGAYLDNRAILSQTGPMVRILAMINQNEIAFPSESYCQLWFENRTEPAIVPVVEYLSIWPKKWGSGGDNSYPHLLSCILPEDHQQTIPHSVSLVEKKYAYAFNLLDVQYEEPSTKQEFAACVKALNFPDTDISARLIEWLEMMRLHGVAKIFIYKYKVHANVAKVLDYYEKSGLIKVIPFSMADGVLDVERSRVTNAESKTGSLLRKRLNELIPYNDCFYRHMYRYDYIALIDIDEIIMPLGNLSTWRDIVVVAEKTRKPNCEATAGICFRNVFFPTYQNLSLSSSSPQHFYMLEHVHRQAVHNKVGSATKCLHNTRHVISLHNHYPRKWLKSCYPQTLNATAAQLQHYREVKKPIPFSEAVHDDNIWRYGPTLINRTTAVLQELTLL